MQQDSTFIAIDVATGETMRHIVGVGLAEFLEGEIDAIASWQSRVDPETDFTRTLRLIDDVTGQGLRTLRTFPQMYPILAEWLQGSVVVAHGDHARRALDAACDRYGLARLDCRWVDVQELAKLALVRRREEQYRLDSLAAWLGIEWPQHDLDRRAIVAGQAAMWCAAIIGDQVAAHTSREPLTSISRSTTAGGRCDDDLQSFSADSLDATGAARGSYSFH